MARYELIFPSLGESVTEAVVTNWLKKVGDPVEAEESIVEVSTDKVDTEVPTDVSGILAEIKFQVNDVVKVGEVIAVIETQEEISTSGEALDVVQQSVASLEKDIANIQQSTSAEPQVDFSKTERFYSPLVKNIAKKEGISLSELDSIKGTGLNDRVTKSDILHTEERTILYKAIREHVVVSGPARLEAISRTIAQETLTKDSGHIGRTCLEVIVNVVANGSTHTKSKVPLLILNF